LLRDRDSGDREAKGDLMGNGCLCIADDGKGSVHQTEVTQDAGSGWGLTIMRKRAELVGGRFRLDTVPGKGTSITVEIEGGV